jgi:glycosyltransferase involved in cell wall biosynthesis
MKILMTYHGRFDINSGAAGSMINIGKSLERLGADVDYFTYNNLPQNWDRRLIHFTFPYFVYQYVHQQKKWDVVDACTGDSWLLGKLKNVKTPKIVIRSSGLEHMDYERQLIYAGKMSLKSKLIWGRLNLKLVELGLKTADKIVALTHQEKQYIETRFAVPSEKIVVIHHVLPLYFRNLPDRESSRKFKILYVGLWHERKGVKYLMEALERLNEEGYNFSVTLAGVRVAESVVRAHLTEHLSSKVDIIPYIQHSCLPQIYLKHSVFVFPSLYEGFGKVLTEAMAAGIPIITTQAGVAEELIEDGRNGVVIPYQDAQAIYQALVWSINHPELLNNYGKNARKLIDGMDFEQSYQWRKEIYQNLIG